MKKKTKSNGIFTFGARNFFAMAMMSIFQKEQRFEENDKLKIMTIGTPGSGKTRGFIKPAISEMLKRQAEIDETCNKIANKLSETIETEW